MNKELEALSDLLLLSKLNDGGKKGMSALKRADYNAHIIYRALERAKKEHELLELYRMKEELQEEYQVNDSTLKRQKALDSMKEVYDEIKQLEEELK